MAHTTPVGSESDIYGTTPVPGPLDTEERGLGWIAFAGTMLMLVGTVNVIYGIAAIGNAHFYAGHSAYVFGSLNTWGWVALLLGITQGLAGLGLFARNQFARWLGVIFAS